MVNNFVRDDIDEEASCPLSVSLALFVPDLDRVEFLPEVRPADAGPLSTRHIAAVVIAVGQADFPLATIGKFNSLHDERGVVGEFSSLEAFTAQLLERLVDRAVKEIPRIRQRSNGVGHNLTGLSAAGTNPQRAGYAPERHLDSPWLGIAASHLNARYQYTATDLPKILRVQPLT